MKIFKIPRWCGYLVSVLLMAIVLAGCGNLQAGEGQQAPPLSNRLLPPVQLTVQLTANPTVQPAVQRTARPTVQPVPNQTIQPTLHLTAGPTVQPTLFVLGPIVDPNLGIRAGPVAVPLELRIPSLKVNAPVLAVGLTSNNVMDAPKGQDDDPVWHTAFWYRGGSIPGDPGTSTIAGHVNDLLGQPQIFAHLRNLHPGDLIIIHDKNTNLDIRFIVDRVKIYSVQESSDPAVLTQIYGAGPVAGTGPQPSLDGLSHMTLITCSGYFVQGLFDHHAVVFATRIK